MILFQRKKEILRKVDDVFINTKNKIKMNKDIIIFALVIGLIALAGFTYYLYSGAQKCGAGIQECIAQATELGTQLQACAVGVDQCTAGATQCQTALTTLQQTCAAYLPTD